MNQAPVTKYTLKEWVKHPTTIILIISVNVIWILIFIVVDMGKDKSKDCMEQVTYLRDRVESLERNQDKYVTAILYRNAQVKNRDSMIDSLNIIIEKYKNEREIQ